MSDEDQRTVAELEAKLQSESQRREQAEKDLNSLREQLTAANLVWALLLTVSMLTFCFTFLSTF